MEMFGGWPMSGRREGTLREFSLCLYVLELCGSCVSIKERENKKKRGFKTEWTDKVCLNTWDMGWVRGLVILPVHSSKDPFKLTLYLHNNMTTTEAPYPIHNFKSTQRSCKRLHMLNLVPTTSVLHGMLSEMQGAKDVRRTEGCIHHLICSHSAA